MKGTASDLGKRLRPFTMFSNGRLKEVSDHLAFELTLIGNETASFPYIYRAVVNGGKSGMFKERVPYSVEDVTVQGESVLSAGGPKDDLESCVWRFQGRSVPKRKNVCIELSSPLRLKASNRLAGFLSYSLILESLLKRVGDIHNACSGGTRDFWKHEIVDRPIESRIFWHELAYFSARQRVPMTLGGFVGVVEVKEAIPAREFSLLKAGELFHVGSKSAFGFGRIRVFKKC